MRITIPELRTHNTTNVRMHWRMRSKHIARTREAVTEALYEQDWTIPAPTEARPWDVLLVRLGPRELDDDGVVSALKGVRDAVAAFVGVDDRTKRLVRYSYDQRKQRCFGVEIEIRQRPALT